MHAWVLRRMVSLFARSAKRGHYPRQKGMQDIYKAAGIPLPPKPRALFFIIAKIKYIGWGCGLLVRSRDPYRFIRTCEIA